MASESKGKLAGFMDALSVLGGLFLATVLYENERHRNCKAKMRRGMPRDNVCRKTGSRLSMKPSIAKGVISARGTRGTRATPVRLSSGTFLAW
jgi:hypothetical protein